MIPTTRERVPSSTANEVNRQIRQQTDASVAHVALAPRNELEQRLRELDEEWDVERAIEANAAAIMLLGVSLGFFAHRRFFFLPAVVGGFLLQHAIQGWCPPVPILRRLGFRTQTEIDEERFALKALRGDFDGANSADAVLRAARA